MFLFLLYDRPPKGRRDIETVRLRRATDACDSLCIQLLNHPETLQLYSGLLQIQCVLHDALYVYFLLETKATRAKNIQSHLRSHSLQNTSNHSFYCHHQCGAPQILVYNTPAFGVQQKYICGIIFK